MTYSYSLTGQIDEVVDANGNRAQLRYDGHDRQTRWVFPSKARPTSFNNSTAATALASAGVVNESDYEQYAYDDNGNRTSLRKRDGSVITYQYDALNRMTRKTVPNRADLPAIHERDVFYSYDLRGLATSSRFNSASGEGVINAYDGFGRMTGATDTVGGGSRALAYQYDKNGNRTQMTYPGAGGGSFTYEYDGLNRVTALKGPSGTALISLTYNDRGLAASAARAGAAHDKTFGYDPAGRLQSLALTSGVSPANVSWSYTRNPASQIKTETQSNDSYSWDGHVDLSRSYTTNGLNQYESAGGASFCYDQNGNLTADGSSVYLYDIENRLVEKRTQTNTACTSLSYAGALEAELRYDPLGRLDYTRDWAGSNGITRFHYDGDAMVAEYASDGSTILRRYVHGTNADADDPLVQYEGTSLAASNARYLYADTRGSIVLTAGASGNTLAQNTYDEYGIPSASNAGRFQYTR